MRCIKDKDKDERQRRADELEPASPSFLVFFSLHGIYKLRQWESRWCVRHQRLRTPPYIGQAGHRSRKV
jgi:hypothetical protein